MFNNSEVSSGKIVIGFKSWFPAEGEEKITNSEYIPC